MRVSPRAAPTEPPGAHLESDGRGLVAVHGDGGRAVQRPEHAPAEGGPGHRRKLLRDRGLGAGAHFLVVEPGRGRGEGAAWRARAVGLMGAAVGDTPPQQAGSGRFLPNPTASVPVERLLRDRAQRVPQASSRLSRTRGWGPIGDACLRHQTGTWRRGGHVRVQPAPRTQPGSLALTQPPHGGVLCCARGRGPPAGTLPGRCHLFTTWKYFCRKAGSTVLLQSSSSVWG